MAAGSDAMADAEGRAFHRLRNYPAAGINWRPTRFVEPVPSSRVCCVCGTIPSLTASLPCLHSICDSCIRISRQDGRNVCPLDGEPFVEHECSWNVFAESEMRNLRAHCWNVPWGCEFVGDMEAVLRHYEEECTFHALECPHCRTAVRPTNLLTHCMAVGADSASPERTSEPSLVRRGGQTARGMNVPLEELVALMRGAGRDELAIIQTLLNELLERASNFGSCLSEVARDVAALRHNPVDATAVAPSGNSSALVSYGVDSAINLHQGNSGVAHAAGTSTSIEPSNEVALRMLASYCSVSLSAVKELNRKENRHRLRTNFIREFPDRVVLGLSPQPYVRYTFEIDGADKLFYCPMENLFEKFSDLALRHDNGVVLQLSVFRYEQYTSGNSFLMLYLTFILLDRAGRVPTHCSLTVMHGVPGINKQMEEIIGGTFCYSQRSCSFSFHTELDPLRGEGYLHNNKLYIQAVVYV